jgi:hypothetical protein
MTTGMGNQVDQMPLFMAYCEFSPLNSSEDKYSTIAGTPASCFGARLYAEYQPQHVEKV